MTSVTDFVWRKDSGIKTSAAQTPHMVAIVNTVSASFGVRSPWIDRVMRHER